ncbi:Hypothetical_protein [Hexamita inflata]|uniref:Hypothetical_protein n=1 Tax=Hexamita inflata TaxID=28002 RepID=A0ABP1HPC7_9EUKA
MFLIQKQIIIIFHSIYKRSYFKQFYRHVLHQSGQMVAYADPALHFLLSSLISQVARALTVNLTVLKTRVCAKTDIILMAHRAHNVLLIRYASFGSQILASASNRIHNSRLERAGVYLVLQISTVSAKNVNSVRIFQLQPVTVLLWGVQSTTRLVISANAEITSI